MDQLIKEMENQIRANDIQFKLDAIDYMYKMGQISKQEFDDASKQMNEAIDELTGRNNPDLPKISLQEIDERLHTKKMSENS